MCVGWYVSVGVGVVGIKRMLWLVVIICICNVIVDC